ncbi:MAG: hypothetical protein M5U23_08620 [Acidimicrobiia bacterium]|nr:hypothetical protein [Acidimicrobiia bacterium]
MLVLAAEAVDGIMPSATTFVVIGFGAFSLPLIARGLGIPAVVLEILFGLAIGPQVLGWIAAESTSEGSSLYSPKSVCSC